MQPQNKFYNMLEDAFNTNTSIEPRAGGLVIGFSILFYKGFTSIFKNLLILLSYIENSISKISRHVEYTHCKGNIYF